jgi:hypothetical protein
MLETSGFHILGNLLGPYVGPPGFPGIHDFDSTGHNPRMPTPPHAYAPGARKLRANRMPKVEPRVAFMRADATIGVRGMGGSAPAKELASGRANGEL